MKKWLIRCLTVLAMVCLIPGIVLKAAAETTTVRCKNCGSVETREILGYRKYDSNSHRFYVAECQNCHNDGNVTYLKVHSAAPKLPPAPQAKPVKNAARNTAFSVTTGARGRLTTTARTRTPADASAATATQLRPQAAAAAMRPATVWECAKLAEGVTTAVTHGASGHPPATAHTSAAA